MSTKKNLCLGSIVSYHPSLAIGKIYRRILAGIIRVKVKNHNHCTLCSLFRILYFAGKLASIIPNRNKKHTLWNRHFLSLFLFRFTDYTIWYRQCKKKKSQNLSGFFSQGLAQDLLQDFPTYGGVFIFPHEWGGESPKRRGGTNTIGTLTYNWPVFP